MSESDIIRLIKKYDKPYVPGEIHLSRTNTLNKRNQRKANKHWICEDLFFECDFFNLSSSQKEFIHYLVDCFENFKELHGRAKKEAIILAFIFYVKKLEDSHINIKNYSICKKYGLTDDVFILVVCRISDYFVKSSPIKYFESSFYDHEILSKNGGRV